MYEFSLRTDLDLFNEKIETVFIEIKKDKIGSPKDVIIGTIYRPPKKPINLFTEELSKLLSTLAKENKILYLMGDYNINLLNADSHIHTSEFIEMMYSFALMPIVNKPTRIHNVSASLIDNIYCNNIKSNHLIFDGIFLCDITDHFPVFCVNNFEKEKFSSHIIKHRVFSEQNMINFKEKLLNLSWNNVISNDSPEESFSNFHTTYVDCYNNCFPIADIKVTYKNKKQWLTLGMKKSIKIKNKLYIRSLKNPTLYNKSVYKKYRNKLNNILCKAIREYFDLLLQENKNNFAKSWKIIKQVINKKNSNISSSKFLINNEIITDGNIIANHFNELYVNLGENLAKHICCNDKKSPESYISFRYEHSMYLKPVDENEIITIIYKMNNSSPGADGITAKILKFSCNLLLKPLTHVLNLSLSSGYFPNELKISQVIPLFKSGDPMQLINYRPVSILSVFSELFEYVMYNRLISFLKKYNILFKYQFGFREKHGTNSALITLVDKILKSWNKGEYVLGLFLDLSKAFDSINHEILINKLYCYGNRGNVLTWFRNYLKNRKQFVTFNDYKSSEMFIKHGVPQGSILGPVLFLLYINDMANISNKLFFLLFADDTNIFISGQNIDEMVETLNQELKKVTQWLAINKLTLNIFKTQYMIFSLSKEVNPINDVIINHEKIKKVSSTKFLGILLDNNLSWSQHIYNIKKKVSKNWYSASGKKNI